MLYILEFSEPLGQGRYGQAKTYLGYCADNRLKERIEEHLQGHGAAITRAVVERGIEIKLIATHKGTRKDEKRYKAFHNNQMVLKAWLREKREKNNVRK